MAAEETNITFKMRELQAQDEQGRQFVLRVDEQGTVVCTALFDSRGAEIKLAEGAKIHLSIAISTRAEDKGGLVKALCICYRRDQYGNIIQYTC